MSRSGAERFTLAGAITSERERNPRLIKRTRGRQEKEEANEATVKREVGRSHPIRGVAEHACRKSKRVILGGPGNEEELRVLWKRWRMSGKGVGVVSDHIWTVLRLACPAWQISQRQ